MLPQPTLKISEIFSSVQGEGLRQGEATVFVRLSGCNLRCDFCDTKHAWAEGEEMRISAVLNRIELIRESFPADWICLTGGEPMLQNIDPLVRSLKKKELAVQVETNATLFRDLPIDWHTISPKPPDYSFRPEYVSRAREVKLVVTRDLSQETISDLRWKFPESIPLILQPQSGFPGAGEKSYALLRSGLGLGLKNLRIGLQMHVVLGFK